MKAIIIAAGQGSRLMPITNSKPKCMLEIEGEGKTFLQHQLDVFHANGITGISVISGYKKEVINYSGLKYYINDNYMNKRILKQFVREEGIYITKIPKELWPREV